jgi:hypothetical protein
LISLTVSELCPGQSSKCKNEQRAITTKFGNTEFKFLCTALLISLVVLELFPGQDFLKAETIQILGKTTELWFFDTALPLNALYHCMKFKQIISKGFQVMLWKRQRTDRQTRPPLLCSPKFFGEHKNVILKWI